MKSGGLSDRLCSGLRLLEDTALPSNIEYRLLYQCKEELWSDPLVQADSIGGAPASFDESA
jgi:hypothetical protein